MGDIIEELDPLFNPKSVAVIGATNNWNKWGYSTFSSALQGDQVVYPVNWREKKVLEHDAFKRVTDIPGPVDLAIFVIPSENIPPVMEDCVEKGVKAGVIISAGLRETGEEGRKLENEILSIARRGGLRFAGPNCMGMWSASSNLRAFMFPMPAVDGPLAFVTQGGNLGGAVAMSAFARGLGFHGYVSCGPAADIQIEDYIEYFGKDPGVKIILTYIEGLNDGRRFMQKVREVTRKKPVIALKPGKSEATADAISSHSGTLSGSYELSSEAFKKIGVMRTKSPEELLDVAIGFLTQPLPMGRNVAIITGGGSYGVICTESCEDLGLNVIKLPKEVIDEFNKIFPPRWSHGNPVDPAGDRNFMAYMKAPDMLLRLDSVDSLIFMGFGSLSGFSSMLSSGGLDSFIKPMTSMFTSVSGLDKLVESFASEDPSTSIKRMRPLLSAFGSSFDSTAEEMEKFFMSSSGDASSFIELFSALPQLATGDASKMTELLEKFDPLIRTTLLRSLKEYGKPIITTTFTEMPSVLQGASYGYTTSDKAAVVLSKLVEYREHLEKIDADFDKFSFCHLLNEELEKLG